MTTSQPAAPSVYRIQKDNLKSQNSTVSHNLYLGEFSTRQGLSLFDFGLPFQAIELTDDQIPKEQSMDRVRAFKTVQPALAFFADEQNHLRMVDFRCKIDDQFKLSTHDDGECSLEFPDSSSLEKTFRRSAPSQHANALWEKSTKHEGCYVALDSHGETLIYPTFDEYVAAIQ